MVAGASGSSDLGSTVFTWITAPEQKPLLIGAGVVLGLVVLKRMVGSVARPHPIRYG